MPSSLYAACFQQSALVPALSFLQTRGARPCLVRMQQRWFQTCPQGRSGSSSSRWHLGVPAGPAGPDRTAVAASCSMPLLCVAPCTTHMQARRPARSAAGQPTAAAGLWSGAERQHGAPLPQMTRPTCAGAPPGSAPQLSLLRRTACSARARCRRATHRVQVRTALHCLCFWHLSFIVMPAGSKVRAGFDCCIHVSFILSPGCSAAMQISWGLTKQPRPLLTLHRSTRSAAARSHPGALC